MSILDDILPPQRYDEAPVTAPLRQLLEALTAAGGERPRISIEVDDDAWRRLETMWRRPYRPHATVTYLALEAGTVEFRRRPVVASALSGHEGQPWPDPSRLVADALGPTLTPALALADHEMEWPPRPPPGVDPDAVTHPCQRPGCGRPPNEHPAPKTKWDAAALPPPPPIPAIERNEPQSWTIRLTGISDGPGAHTGDAEMARAVADAINEPPNTGEVNYAGPWRGPRE